MKAIKKEFYMEIKNTASRFISIMLIVALGVAFYAGICSSEPDMRLSADKYYDDGSLMDIRVLSTVGITDEIVDDLAQIEGVETVKGAYSLDFINVIGDEEGVISLQSYTQGVNEPMLQSGRLPEGEGECIVEATYADSHNIEIGDELTLSSGNVIPVEMQLSNNVYTVTGTYLSSYYIGMDRGTTTIGNGKINGVIMVEETVFLQPVYTSAYIVVKNAKEETAYTDEYYEIVDDVKEKIEAYVGNLEGQYYVLDRTSIQTYMEFDQDAERIGNIGKVIPLIFFIVAALVSLTTMTRMVEEQRTQIGTLKALGYTKWEVASKYIKYALYATVTGSVIGGILGSIFIPKIIIYAYSIMYNIQDVLTPINGFYFTLACGLAIVLVLIATVFSCYRELMDNPAMLMRPEPPKKTKKVALEHIPFIWKHISFSMKSTIRNLVRYKKRLFMTLFGISGCMALLVIGFGLRDSINSVISIQYDELHKYEIVLSLENNISDEDIASLKENIESNESVGNYIFLKQSSMTFETEDGSITGYIYVSDDPDKFTEFITLRDRHSHEKYELSDDGIMLSEKTADKLNVEEGDTIDLVVSDTEKYSVKISKVVENYVYHNVYMTRDYYEKVIGDMEYNQIIFKLTDDGKDKEEDIIEELLTYGGVNGASYIDRMREKFEDMLGSLDIITLVIVLAAGGLAFIVLFNLNNININERRRELATLKVLGFYDIEVSQYIYRENVIITIIGIIVGSVLGNILHEYVITTAEVDAVMFGRDVKMLSYLWSALITAVFTVIINLSMHFKLKKVDMATSLKSVE